MFWIVFSVVGSTALLMAAWRRNRTASRLLKQAEESLARAEKRLEDDESGYPASAIENRFPLPSTQVEGRLLKHIPNPS
jgi:hypothetical protein